MKPTVIVVDDESAIRLSVRDILVDADYEVVLCAHAEALLSWLQKRGPAGDSFLGAVLLDIWLPGRDGLDALQVLQERYPRLPVIMISGHGTVDLAVRATKHGAYHFLEKPFSEDALLLTLKHALREARLEHENRRLREQSRRGPPPMVGESTPFRELVAQVERAAKSDARVLIQGENGTGKEAVAHMLHTQSERHARPFVELNCAAIPEDLIESELFGHEKGAFTGATQSRKGKFDQADGGTLFLDEIGDMSLKTQAKILRVLAEQRFERVGGHGLIEVDVRVVAASNKPLAQLVAENAFRADLYYRLNVLSIEVPPLRARLGDLPLLVHHFLRLFVGHHGKRLKTIESSTLALLERYPWPGNIRELKNIVERMVIMSGSDAIGERDIPPSIMQVLADPAAHPALRAGEQHLPLQMLTLSYRSAREEFERRYLQAQLDAHQGNVSRTAEKIGLERSHLHKKLKQLALDAAKA